MMFVLVYQKIVSHSKKLSLFIRDTAYSKTNKYKKTSLKEAFLSDNYQKQIRDFEVSDGFVFTGLIGLIFLRWFLGRSRS